MRFKEFFHLMEAFPLGWAKAYRRKNAPLYKKENPFHEALEKLFKGKDRLVYYIPPTTDVEMSYEGSHVYNFLQQNGYEPYYFEGYAIKKGDRHKQKINIGKLLQRLESQDTTTEVHNIHNVQHTVKGGKMLYYYKNDEKRRLYNKSSYAVLSRHEYDIKGLGSADRNWLSCMTSEHPLVVRGTGNYKADVENYNKLGVEDRGEMEYGDYVNSRYPGSPYDRDVTTSQDYIAAYLVRYDFDRSKDILRRPLDRHFLTMVIDEAGNVKFSDCAGGGQHERNSINTINNYTQFGKFLYFITQKDWNAVCNIPTVDLKELYRKDPAK